MTTLVTVTVLAPTPSLDRKAQEVALASRTLELAAQLLRSQGGLVTNGNITGDGGVLLGSFAYTPVASS